MCVLAVLKGKVAAWRKAYRAAHPTQQMQNLAESLPLLFIACMGMSGWGPAKRVQTWALILIRLTHGSRASSFSQYCPTTFALPPQRQEFYDRDGIPQWIAIKYEGWKGKKDSDPAIWLMIHRNVYRADLCPVNNKTLTRARPILLTPPALYLQVVNLLQTLIITEWKKGPLFGNLDRNGRLLKADVLKTIQVGDKEEKVWMTREVFAAAAVPAAEGRPAIAAIKGVPASRVNFTAAQLGGRSERLFDALGFFDLCDHTWRVMFCVWAAQCGGDLLGVIATGLWNPDMSAEWHKYFASGLQRQHTYINSGTPDPLPRVFPYPEKGMLLVDYEHDPATDLVHPQP